MTLVSNEFLQDKLRLTKNPFLELNSENETGLKEYFIDLEAFYRVLDIGSERPKTSILVAPRGFGKSANRKSVETWLQQGPPSIYQSSWPWPKNILTIPYLNFARIIEQANWDFGKITPALHVTEILRLAVPALYKFLEEHLDLLSANYHPALLSRLAFYTEEYSHLYADLPYLTEKDQKPTTLLPPVEALLLAAFRYKSSVNTFKSDSYIEQIRNFSKIAEEFGVKSIVILIDRVDENTYTGNSPEKCADILTPLISEQELMHYCPNMVFKFFLTNEIVAELKKRSQTRIGERVDSYSIDWTEEDLVHKLVSQRLRAFSRNHLTQLAELATNESRNIGLDLAKHADNNPRQMLKLCNMLLVEMENRYKRSGRSGQVLAIPEDVQAVIREFNEENSLQAQAISSAELEAPTIPSPKVIEITSDHYVRYKGKIISSGRLTPKEYELLSFFIANPEVVLSRERIGEAVWKTKWLDTYNSALDQSVLRLRQKIGAKFFETVHGSGYIFHLHPSN